MEAIFVTLMLGLTYFLPTIIAVSRKHHRMGLVALWNVLTGWTLFALVPLLIWAVIGKTKAKSQAQLQAKSDQLLVTASQGNRLVAVGAGGTMSFDGREVTITRKGGASFLIHGFAGEKSIPLASIQAVQFRNANHGVRGYLQLTILGGIESRGGAIGAAGDENSVLFDVAQEQVFRTLAERLRAAINQRNSPQPSVATTGADELMKLGDLHDRGLLSREEFDRQKSSILERSS